MKNPLSSIMLGYIKEEPALFRALLADRENLTRDFVQLFLTHDFKRIYFSGSGSPSHVSLVGKYAAVKLLKIEASYSYPGLFNYHEGFNIGGKYKPEEMLLICPAESGRTKGPVIAARKAKELGIPVVSTTLFPDGVLARESTVVIPKPYEKEKALPSTKGHSAGLFIILLCILDAAKAIGSISAEEYDSYMADMAALADSCRSACEAAIAWFDAHQDIVMCADKYRIIGYGANYSTTLETALKFIESHQRPTMAYELEEFMHGPIRTVHKDDVLFFLLAEDGPEKDRMLDLFHVMRKLTDNCVLVQSSADAFTDPLSLTFDAVNRELLSAVEYMVPMQVLAYLIMDHLGFDSTSGRNTFAKLEMQPSFTD